MLTGRRSSAAIRAPFRGELLIRHVRGFDFEPTPQLRCAMGSAWRNSEEHHWYVAYIDGKQAGCVGMALVRTSSGLEARFGPEWVMPGHHPGELCAVLRSMRESLAAYLCAKAHPNVNA